MGNQPSSPTTPTKVEPAPLPAVCGTECQRQKKLSGLKAALDAKTATKATDPAGYEAARVAYMTELNGQGWLSKEKERIAKDEVEPVLTSYQNKYKSLKEDTKSQGVFANLMNMLKADESSNQEDLKFLKKQETSETDKANVLNRLNQLQSGQQPTQSYLPIIIDVALAILGIFIAYTIYQKFSSPTVSTVMVAGKRVLDKLIR